MVRTHQVSRVGPSGVTVTGPRQERHRRGRPSDVEQAAGALRAIVNAVNDKKKNGMGVEFNEEGLRERFL
jgi:hypothetical protein